jgi:chromosome segregation ATPase
MAGKLAKPSECERRIKDILDGNVEAYVRWADMQVQGLQRDREHLKKQVRVAEQRCAATERMLKPAMDSEVAQRERAENAEKRLAQAEARLAEMAAKHQKHSETNRPLEKAITKLARNPVVVKKLVLVCHPDKCPRDVSDSATELFRFLQSIRDKTKS